jgi:hypothetical protein
MARKLVSNDPFCRFPGDSPAGCLISMIGSIRSTADGLVIIPDRMSNRPLAVLDPADFPGQYRDNSELIIRDINRSVAQHNLGRKVELPDWAMIDID